MDLAAAAGVGATRLSAWELGDRGHDLVRTEDAHAVVERIGRLLGAPGALPSLWSSVGTPDGLPARSDWAHNFSPSGRPCWVWIRCLVDAAADLQWGRAVRGRVQVPAGPGGVLVAIPTSVHNPPLEVSLSAPGWSDAGAGVVPSAVAEALGARLVEAQEFHQQQRPDRLRPLPADLDDTSRLLQRLARKFRIRWDLVAPHVAEVLRPSGQEHEHALQGADLAAAGAGAPALDGDGRLQRQLLLAGDQVRALRQARGFSRRGAKDHANALDPDLPPLSRPVLERLEKNGTVPAAPLALARLDTVYRADGRLGIERTFDSRSTSAARSGPHWRSTVSFPVWWIGPVWLQPMAPGGRSDTASMTLRWGPWVRRRQVASGRILTTRKAPTHNGTPSSAPLVADLPAGWWLTAGTGAVPAALDIGQGWQPASLRAAIGLIRLAADAITGKGTATVGTAP